MTVYVPVLASLLFIGGVMALAVIGIINARFFAEVQRSRSHRISADAQQEALEASQEALEEIEQRRATNRRQPYAPQPPDDADFLETILEERGEVTTTDANAEREMADHEQGEFEIPPDRMYRTEEVA